MRSIAPATVAILAIASAATAQVTYLSQARTVDANSIVESAPDFAPFDAEAEYEFVKDTGDLIVTVSSDAKQVSTLDPDIIFIDSEAGGSAGLFTSVFAASRFEVTFQVTEPVIATLSGLVWATSVDDDSFSSGRVGLSRIDGAGVIGWSTTDNSPVNFMSDPIDLAPGSYRLTCNASGGSSGKLGGARGYADVTVVFESKGCPADLNGDEVLDLADIAAFIVAFTGMAPAADLDGNGIYDLADIQAFVDAFTAGCP